MTEPKRIACVHWSDVGHPRAGRCGQGLHGGLPSVGTCRRCDAYEGPPRGLGDVVAGAVKLATAGLVKPCVGCARRKRKWNSVGRRNACRAVIGNFTNLTGRRLSIR